MVTTFIVSLFTLLHVSSGQECLSEPPELIWNGNHGALEFDAYTATIAVDGQPITFRTRGHRDGDETASNELFQFPSPTIRVQAGEAYVLTLRNLLTPDVASDLVNGIKNVNFTNIHTHGAHISGEHPVDNIFHPINGGTEHDYVWNFPCDHASGTMWYHPHVHGSTALHVGGGAFGALIIENDAELSHSSFPDWYRTLLQDDFIVVIQYIDLGALKRIGDGVDHIFNAKANIVDDTPFYAVNGRHKPTICMEQNKWKKLNIVFGDIENPDTTFLFPVEPNQCVVYLLSRDGVLIHGASNEVPRLLRNGQVTLTLATRIDVAISCANSETYEVQTASGKVVFSLKVDANAANVLPELTPFYPQRPYYLQSLLDETVSAENKFTVKLSPIKVNGVLFQDGDTFLHEMVADTVQEWSLNGQNSHPFHIHIHHFQLTANRINTDFVQRGDWVDTLTDNSGIRFRVDRYGGRVVLHCHVLEHEDNGALGVVLTHGGCDGDGNDYDYSPMIPGNTAPPTSGPVPSCSACVNPWLTSTTSTTTTTTTTTTTSSTTICLLEGVSCRKNGDIQCCDGLRCHKRKCQQ